MEGLLPSDSFSLSRDLDEEKEEIAIVAVFIEW